MLKSTKRKQRRIDFFYRKDGEQQERAKKITLVMDNLDTRVPGSLYETFQPERQRQYETGLSLYTPQSIGAG